MLPFALYLSEFQGTKFVTKGKISHTGTKVQKLTWTICSSSGQVVQEELCGTRWMQQEERLRTLAAKRQLLQDLWNVNRRLGNGGWWAVRMAEVPFHHVFSVHILSP